MGLKHLKMISNFLRSNPEEWFNRTEIRDTLKIDFNTMLDCLAYLVSDDKVVVDETTDIVLYKWKGEE